MKKILNSIEEVKAAKTLGLTVHKRMRPEYYINVQPKEKTTPKAPVTRSKTPRENWLVGTDLVIWKAYTFEKSGSQMAKVHSAAKFILKTPMSRNELKKKLSKHLDGYTVPQCNTIISDLYRAGALSKVAPGKGIQGASSKVK